MNRPVRMGRSPVRWVAFGLGVGLLPMAPGTFGTLLAVPLVLLLAFLDPWLYAIVCVALVGMAIMVADRVEHQLGQEDPGVIVIDEVAGFVVAMAFLPAKLWVVVIAFAIFRVLDIFKPPPIDWIERRFKGGVAIVADDVVAGLLTNAVVHLLLLLVGSP
ncbi:MAG: phosphatidylglycerophosphatase A [Arenicellales bacterium]|nr:phosphatidylglycerophosphatase A [Arenicellales bacterium]